MQTSAWVWTCRAQVICVYFLCAIETYMSFINVKLITGEGVVPSTHGLTAASYCSIWLPLAEQLNSKIRLREKS